MRYAAILSAAEINSTFYRPHRASTFARWAAETPDAFRFSVKAPRAITHERRLADTDEVLVRFLEEVEPFRAKLGVLLLQLPPSLAFDRALAEAFFAALRRREPGLPAACEPRHESWFGAEADGLLASHCVARVAADPLRHPLGGDPGGWRGLRYYRLHGSPRMYFSAYGAGGVEVVAQQLAHDPSIETWCIFDNTASGAAAADAIALTRRLAELLA